MKEEEGENVTPPEDRELFGYCGAEQRAERGKAQRLEKRRGKRR